MKRIACLLVLVMVTVVGGWLATVSAAGADSNSPHVVRENIEWLDVWMPNSNSHDKPQVLLVGDSITRLYYPQVAKLLRGKAYVSRLATSKCVGDPALIKEIAAIVSEQHFDVIHFNNGMHGFGYSEDEYAAAYPKFIKAIEEAAPGAKLICATTTPTHQGEGMKQFDPRTPRIQVRNTAAVAAAKHEGATIDDLFAAVKDHSEYYAGGDGVHPNHKGAEALAQHVAGSITAVLKK